MTEDPAIRLRAVREALAREGAKLDTLTVDANGRIITSDEGAAA